MNSLAWYHFAGTPAKLCIGPSGHGDAQWRELEHVATPEPRRVNPFYMEAEAQCVMQRHRLTLPPACVSYSIPGGSTCPTFSPEYFAAYDAFRTAFISKQK